MRFNVQFKASSQRFTPKFGIGPQQFAVGFKALQVVTQTEGDFGIYEGATVVTPQASHEVVLETAQKLLREDITVKKIPYYEVSNDSGGTTIYIATEE